MLGDMRGVGIRQRRACLIFVLEWFFGAPQELINKWCLNLGGDVGEGLTKI